MFTYGQAVRSTVSQYWTPKQKRVIKRIVRRWRRRQAAPDINEQRHS